MGQHWSGFSRYRQFQRVARTRLCGPGYGLSSAPSRGSRTRDGAELATSKALTAAAPPLVQASVLGDGFCDKPPKGEGFRTGACPRPMPTIGPATCQSGSEAWGKLSLGRVTVTRTAPGPAETQQTKKRQLESRLLPTRCRSAWPQHRAWRRRATGPPSRPGSRSGGPRASARATPTTWTGL